MKTKICFIILLSFIFGLLSSQAQVPQGFNYQAVARLTTGDPIINTTLPVRITIQADSLGTSIIWQELHSSVTTNGFGLITLILGKGARQAVSTVAAFNAIDWTITPKFIKTEIDYSGWKTMGVTRFWSVPYSKIAENLGGPVKKLAVTGTTLLNDEALFEVKNKDGNTVFAVYNEGVRVYVADGAKGLKGGFAVGGFGTDKDESQKYMVVSKDSTRIYIDNNPLTKKLKGGFAVGGYDMTKGLVMDYLDINPDSIRIYIDTDPSTKKLKGGFAVGGYDITKGATVDYLNVAADATGIINPSQNRILWYPLKNAFLTGRVLIESKDSVGVNSFASGYESKAIGQYSQALGYQAIARKNYSTAIGYQAVANKINSFAFGQWALAKNEESYAIGRGAIAEGFRSYAFGSSGVDSLGQITGVAFAKGNYSFAIGQGSRAEGVGSFSIGLSDTARGPYSVTIGYSSSNNGYFATSIGAYCRAKGFASTAVGYSTVASGSYSTAFGRETTASGMYSTALGAYSKARGEYSTSIGRSAESSGYSSTALGQQSKAIGMYSTAIGMGAQSQNERSLALSSFSAVASGIGSTAIGSAARAKGQNSVAIGSGDAEGMDSRLLGYVAETYGTYSTAIGYYSRALGDKSIALGDHPEAQATSSMALGYYTVSSGNYSTALGSNTWTYSGYEIALGRYNTWYSAVSTTGWDPNDRLFVIGNGTSSTLTSDALTILKNGCVGIGTSKPGTKLAIAGLTGTTSGNYLRVYNDNVYYYSSSIKTKTDIEPLNEDFYKILQAKPVSFTDKVSGERNIGFIAEDFDAKGLNNLVIYKDGEPISLSYELISIYNLEIIKDQQKAIEKQTQQIESQQQQIEKLEKLVRQLMAER